MKKQRTVGHFSGKTIPPAGPKPADLSDKTIIVLLLLVVVVSIISVVVYLQVLNAVSLPESNAESNVDSLQAQGTATLQIIERPKRDSGGPSNTPRLGR